MTYTLTQRLSIIKRIEDAQRKLDIEIRDALITTNTKKLNTLAIKLETMLAKL